MPRPRAARAPVLLLLLLLLAIALHGASAWTLLAGRSSSRHQRVPRAASRSMRMQIDGQQPRQQPQQQEDLPAAMDRRRLVAHQGAAATLLLSFGSLASAPRPAFAATAEEAMMVAYESPSKVFSFDYPDSFALAPKPLQTHQEEVTMKSTTVKGFSAGVAVDPVRIDKVTQAGTPAEVGGRIVALEGKKEGVSKVELLASSADGDYYAFDYAVESTRGKNRYLARATVVDKKLVVFTVQVPIAGYADQEPLINRMLASFQAPARK